MVTYKIAGICLFCIFLLKILTEVERRHEVIQSKSKAGEREKIRKSVKNSTTRKRRKDI